jgi:hypothetical protein
MKRPRMDWRLAPETKELKRARLSGRLSSDKAYQRALDISARGPHTALLTSLGSFIHRYHLKTIRDEPTVHSMLIVSADADGLVKGVVDYACDLLGAPRFLEEPGVRALIEEEMRGGASYREAARKVIGAFLDSVAATPAAMGGAG